MAQVNLKLDEAEYEALKLYAEREKLAYSSALRTIINKTVKEWRKEFLVTEYCAGRLGFKKGWKLSGLNFGEWLRALEESGQELQIPETIEKISEAIASDLDPRVFMK